MLLLSLVFAFAGQLAIPSAAYVVPDPGFKIFQKGFSVSVPDEPGITIFAFHGNINKRMVGLEAGEFSKDVLTKTGDHWVFTDSDTELKTGDVIYYWLFVIRNGLGYRYDNGVYVVHETSQGRPADVEFSKPSPTCSYNLDLYNLTKSIISLQNEVKKLTEVNEILTKLVEDGSRKPYTLKLTGVLPPHGDGLQVAEDVVNDKLGLKVKIEQARRNDDQTISFTVKDLSDKVSVISSAKEKLKNSKIGLSY